MSAELADRQDSSAENTVRLSAIPTAETLTSIARYKILSELGRGAMARVYLALDPNIHRKVALKVLEPRGLVTALDMDELRTRFLLEARAAGNLRHSAAVAIYDADHDPDTGLSFIAMEWVDGESLDHLLKRETSLSPDQAIAIICQIAGALDTAHNQGLIHRDVKPANILLDRRGNAKLSDFGIAKSDSLELTSTGQVLGTPFYMSPEQIRDEDLDGRSDLFSLGVVLYQSLTGQQPFQAASLPALTHKILHVDPAPPRSANSSIPTSLDAATLKALDKDPNERFWTGAEMAEALGSEIPPVDETVHLSHPSFHAFKGAADATEKRKSNRTRGLLGTLFLMAALLGVGTAVWKSDPTIEPPAQDVSPAISEPRSGGTEPDAISSAASAVSVPRSAGPAPDAISSADSASTTKPAAAATLQISYTNRLKKATLNVWVDGEPVLTMPVHGPRGIVKRTVGRTILKSIPVSTGHHDVRVSLRGTAGKIEASNRAGNIFDAGQTRRLRVELIPPSYLNLSWK